MAAPPPPADQEIVERNPAHESSVVPRPQKELGRGKHRLGHPLVFRSVEERWFINVGWSLQLTAPMANLLHRFGLGELKRKCFTLLRSTLYTRQLFHINAKIFDKQTGSHGNQRENIS